MKKFGTILAGLAAMAMAGAAHAESLKVGMITTLSGGGAGLVVLADRIEVDPAGPPQAPADGAQQDEPHQQTAKEGGRRPGAFCREGLPAEPGGRGAPSLHRGGRILCDGDVDVRLREKR